MIPCPSRLCCGGLNLQILVDRRAENYGATDTIAQEILFGKDGIATTGERRMGALIHEYIHACDSSHNIPDSWLEHTRVRWLASIMVDFLRQLGIDCELAISHLPQLEPKEQGGGS